MNGINGNNGINNQEDFKPFCLSEKFLDKYKKVKPPFGFNGLGEIVYMRSYSRNDEFKGNEQWWETCRRVVEGTYNMQKRHIEFYHLGWNPQKAAYSAQEMYDRMFNMKFLPPGRGIRNMGSSVIEERGLYASLTNCSFVSTARLKSEPTKPFEFMMDMSMLGCLSKDSLIMTAEGPKRIDCLKGHPFVAMVDGKPYLAPVGSWITGVKQLYALKTSEGFELKLTGNHKVAMQDGTWKKTSTLIPGDIIKVNKHIEISWSGKGTYAQGYLCGAFCGDGYDSRDPIACVCDGDIDHEGIMDEALKCVQKVKRNKDEIEQTSKEFHKGFLRGAFDADGCVLNTGNGTHSVRLDQSSYKDLQCIQRMLLRFGIYSTIYTKRKDDSIYLAITRESIPIFHREIGFAHTVKAQKLAKIVKENTFYRRKFIATIVSVEAVNREEVWDIGVDILHAFDANGLYVHNCGVGFDVRGAGQLLIKGPDVSIDSELYLIPDSREGWVESLRKHLNSYFVGGQKCNFSYANIRKSGEPIRGFGGVSSGPQPLKDMHKNIEKVLKSRIGEYIDEEAIADIMNYIGVCVVSGNVRRSAQLMLGDPTNKDYLNLKDYWWNKDKQKFEGSMAHRAGHGWAANNSVFAELGMDYSEVATYTQVNGEPGYIWLENMRGYSQMVNGCDNKDHKVVGVNPCSEIALEDMECCNLVETFPAKHDDLNDFIRTLKFAYLYSKTVTLGRTHWAETNRVMLRNRRIGCSISGVQQFVGSRGVNTLKTWLKEGYVAIKKWDDVYSDWFAIPKSIKVSTIKPSGSVSLLAGSTPGMHWPISRFQIRRIRIPLGGLLAKRIISAGYRTEPDVTDSENTLVAEVPIDVGRSIRVLSEVSMWEQLQMAAFLQRYWADNQVSSTITFDPTTEGHNISHALNYFQYMLKGVSFLPNNGDIYPQMPIEAIDEEEYKRRLAEIKPINFSNINHDETEVERFCDGDTCVL